MTTYAEIENLGSSLVREYLSRKGLKQTLAAMDLESPRDSASVSNRLLLAQRLHMEKLMKRNKEHPKPLRSMLEIMVKYFLEKAGFPFRLPTEEPSQAELDKVPQKHDVETSWMEKEPRPNTSTIIRPKTAFKEPAGPARVSEKPPSKVGRNAEDVAIEEANGGEQMASKGYGATFKCMPIRPSDDDGIIHRTLFNEENLPSPEPRRYRGISPEDPKFRQKPGTALLPPQATESSSKVAPSGRRRLRGAGAGGRGAGGNANLNISAVEEDENANNSGERSETDSTAAASTGAASTVAASTEGKMEEVKIEEKEKEEKEKEKEKVEREKLRPSSAANRPTRGGRPTSSRPTAAPRAFARSPATPSKSSPNNNNNNNPVASPALSTTDKPSNYTSKNNINENNSNDNNNSDNNENSIKNNNDASASSGIFSASDSATLTSSSSSSSSPANGKPFSSKPSSSDPSSRSSSAGSDKSARPTQSSQGPRSKPVADVVVVDELEDIEDVDADADDDDGVDIASLIPPSAKLTSALISSAAKNVKPMDEDVARSLRVLVFGSSTSGGSAFSEEWLRQGFAFSRRRGLEYGVVQRKGGPCGVLAALQAALLKEMLFDAEDQRWKTGRKGLAASCADLSFRTSALSRALARILWRAGEEKNAVVVAPSGRTHFHHAHNYTADRFTETLNLHTFDSLESLQQFLLSFCESQLMEEQFPATVILLYSAILSRGLDKIRSDFDDPSSRLMGAHNYCTQEMVNLLLCGVAASNVHNNVIRLGDPGAKDEDCVKLKGLTKQNHIGFLSLFEHYGNFEVGTFYKTPLVPIWVICSESHFSVLFCLNRELVTNWKAERRFDLLYYDGLANQEEEICLTVDTTDPDFRPPDEETEMVPPLDHVIRTKWKDARVDWNGTEPLL